MTGSESPWLCRGRHCLGWTLIWKQPQERVLRVVPAAEERAYTNPRACLWVSKLLLEEIFKELCGFRLKDYIMGKSGTAVNCGEAQHLVWADWK